MVTLMSIGRFYEGRIDYIDLFEIVRKSGIQVQATAAGAAVTAVEAVLIAKQVKAQ